MPASAFDAEIDDTQPKRGAPAMFGATFVQCVPPSRVICTFPSSVPAQRTLRSRGLSASARFVQWVSARVLSGLMGPPLGLCFSLSFVVRSGLITFHVVPPSAVLKTTLPA